MHSPLPRKLARLAALATVLGALVLVFAGVAAAHSSACTSRARRFARACSQSRRHHKPAKHARHHGKSKGSKSKRRVHIAPTCEDGSTPTTVGEESTCADGTEAQCPTGTAATFAPDGSIAYCTPEGPLSATPVEPASGNGETSSPCSDGSSATMGGEGAFACANGSEPQCPEPTFLTLSENGSTLVCEASEEGA